jgi:hypothetical protein
MRILTPAIVSALEFSYCAAIVISLAFACVVTY